MADFHETIEAQLSGATVRAAPLVHLDFRSTPERVWQGFGNLTAGGNNWQGIGNLGSLTPVTAGPGLAAEEMTFQLAATEAMLSSFAADADESAGREVNVFFQFFDIRHTDGAGNWVEWATLDSPFQVFWGIMGPLMLDWAEGEDGGQRTRILSITASNAFVNRNRPAWSYFSHRDQQARHSGDNIFVYASRMASAKVKWPHFVPPP